MEGWVVDSIKRRTYILPSVQISKLFDSVTKCKGPIGKINKICIIMSGLNVLSA